MSSITDSTCSRNTKALPTANWPHKFPKILLNIFRLLFEVVAHNIKGYVDISCLPTPATYPTHHNLSDFLSMLMSSILYFQYPSESKYSPQHTRGL
jgi:hypothetical protein